MTAAALATDGAAPLALRERAETPPVAHFVWLGPKLPWLYAMAIRSTLLRGGFADVILHHEAGLTFGADAAAALTTEGAARFVARPLDLGRIGDDAGLPRGPLRALLGKLDAPAARANVIRLLLLAAYGGVYLDTDTVTLRPLTTLRRHGRPFFGVERVVHPVRPADGGATLGPIRKAALSALRSVCAVWAGGDRAFARIAPLYPLAANNAVLGGPSGDPFWRHLLHEALSMPPGRQTRRYALGTHLLQELSVGWRGDPLLVLGPDFFYPLGPGLASHYLRRRADVRLERLLTAETLLVHFYASNDRRSQIERIDPAYVRAHADQQWLSRLLSPLLPA